MTGPRIGYLTALAGCLVLYILSPQWLSWILLLTLLILPWLSLLLSLPAMLTARLTLTAPNAATLGEPISLQVWGSAKLPIPPFRCKCRQTHGFTGRSEKNSPGEEFLPKHCGKITFSVKKAWVYDYLGLFRRRIRGTEEIASLVMPKPIRCDALPPLQRYRAGAWRVKPGGGFAENHEIRSFRPGDPLNQIHWKLSAKTGTWMLREPMVPKQGRAVLSVELSGDPEVLDGKLGQLLYVSGWLLNEKVPHEILALTGQGILTGKVEDTPSQTQFFHQLLQASPADPDARLEPTAAQWQHHIGGAHAQI